MEKQCFKCGETKPLAAFYKHPRMADGHVNKCKECNRKDVRDNRIDKIEYYREYDRARGSRKTIDDLRAYRNANPNKYKAHSLVSYHKKKGNLVPQPCEVCGATEHIHAHHDDYSKPLNVRWLCAAHHQEWHTKNGEGANP